MIRAVEHASPHERVRFQIETEAVARLQHPHIVQLHEVGEVRGQPYFSLEFCDGGTLTEQLKGTPSVSAPSGRADRDAARAMHYAHLSGMVHRDLKPANVLLTAGGTPKITDFGLAKHSTQVATRASRGPHGHGDVHGSRSRRRAGARHGPAADVYALGAMLYECLTGRPRSRRPQLDAVLQREDRGTGAVASAAETPRDLETICLKCLAKEPARRYARPRIWPTTCAFPGGRADPARPVGPAERAVKWVRRHAAIRALTAAVFCWRRCWAWPASCGNTSTPSRGHRPSRSRARRKEPATIS